ncbi:hypothetical protein GCM10009546_51450 [Actinomadura livida]|uniref:Uncharacterized protein n=1 Tax=Actinomadura livida TaxID=79909 RepID=A0A7W7MVR2_9ACTN|nr:hypothetical protein [Actinomadura catellatispora]GGU39621.1 hypothetical protein GCM10010208_74860 [Actinomadura livida]
MPWSIAHAGHWSCRGRVLGRPGAGEEKHALADVAVGALTRRDVEAFLLPVPRLAEGLHASPGETKCM